MPTVTLGRKKMKFMVRMLMFFSLTFQPLSSKNEDHSKSYFEKQADKQATFQVHVDEPDAACTKKPPQVAQTLKAKSTEEESTLAISDAVRSLRQPLARIDVPLTMEVSFGGLEV